MGTDEHQGADDVELGTYSGRLSHALGQLKAPKHRRVPMLAEAIGMTPEGLYIVLKDRTGSRTLTTVNNAKAAQFCQVDPTWLALGEGSMRPRELSADALDVAELYESLGPEQRKKFWLLLQVVREEALPAPRSRAALPEATPLLKSRV